MKNFANLLKECQKTVSEIMPWDLITLINVDEPPLIIDVREADEYRAMHIYRSYNIPRGLLETACEYGFEDTLPILVEAKDAPVIIVCRSGNRSLLAARTMQELGYKNVCSLMTGLRGWNDYDQILMDHQGKSIDSDYADEFFAPVVATEKMRPQT